MAKLTRISGQSSAAASTPASSERLPVVLYVEDEDANWDLAEFSLRNRYHMHRARTAEQACEMLKQREFHLILMDIQLHGSTMSGIELTKLLRGSDDVTAKAPQSAKDLRFTRPIIFVTAYNARYNKDDLKAAGGDDMIPKPVDFTTLSLAISRYLARSIMKMS